MGGETVGQMSKVFKECSKATQMPIHDSSLPWLHVRITWRMYPPRPRAHPNQLNQNPQVIALCSQDAEPCRGDLSYKAQINCDLIQENFPPIVLFMHPTTVTNSALFITYMGNH